VRIRAFAVISSGALLAACASPGTGTPESSTYRMGTSSQTVVGAWEVTASRDTCLVPCGGRGASLARGATIFPAKTLLAVRVRQPFQFSLSSIERPMIQSLSSSDRKESSCI
jgi:hypothetical protein